MFEYVFMQKAFLTGIILSVVISCVGVILVLKRYAMLGDALSHSALAGVCIGLLLGAAPTLTAIIACMAASFAVTLIGRLLSHHKEVAIAIMMSLGIGLSGILSGFIQSDVNLNSYLFGSIVAISNEEFLTSVILGICVLAFFFKFYYIFMYYAFDERMAAQSGIPVPLFNVLFTFLIGITIAISARIVGALIISSMLAVLAACGLLLGRSYRSTLWIAILISALCMISGLTISFYLGWKPGGSIVVLACVFYGFILFFKEGLRR